MKKRTAIFIFLIILYQMATISSCSQNKKYKTIINELINELINLRAPAPDWEEQFKGNSKYAIDPYKYYSETPPDNASSKVLIEYWSAHAQRRTEKSPKPSQFVQKRLLDACEKFPYYCARVLHYLPQKQSTYNRLKILYEKHKQQYSKKWEKNIKKYLMLNSKYFRKELISLAYKVKVEKNENYFENREYLTAIIKLDWEKAKSIIKKLHTSKNKTVRTLIDCILYKRAVKDKNNKTVLKIREKLKTIVENHNEKGLARKIAIKTLMASPWHDQETWFIGLLKDKSLSPLKIGNSFTASLFSNIVHKNPDKWIPLFALQVGNKNVNIHNGAVECLASFNLENARIDALRPIIPWIDNPKWADDPYIASGRLRLIQSLSRIKIPESIPGLIKVAKNESKFFLSAAAKALAYHKVKKAVPILKKALNRKEKNYHKRKILQALLDLNAYTNKELVNAIEQYSLLKLKKIKNPDINTFIGKAILKSNLPEKNKEKLAIAIIKRIHLLQSKNDLELSEQMFTLISDWKNNALYKEITRRLLENELTASLIISALNHRKEIKSNNSRQLKNIFKSSGFKRGIAAALLHENYYTSQILKKNDKLSVYSLLLCARLIRLKLPVKKIEALLYSEDKLMTEIARNYLISEDSETARAAIHKKYPDKFLILGACKSYKQFEELENKLRKKMRSKNPPDEIYALLSAGYWTSAGQIIIYKYKNFSELILLNGKQKTSRLSNRDINKIKKFIHSNNIINLPPYNVMKHDNIQYEFLYLNSKGGRRVFMSDPYGGIYGDIISFFRSLR